MTTPERESVRRQLLALRERLLHRRDDQLLRVEAELETREPAWEDQAAESTDAALGDSLADADLLGIREIDGALVRLAAGTYGECVECHRPIDAARLVAVPTAALCADCAFATEAHLPGHTD
jgi:DnaK suppressor protein